MKKILIMLFISLSSFFVVSAFIRKASGNDNIPIRFVFEEMQRADIGFDIKNDITELTSSLRDLQDGLTYNDDALTAIVNVGKSIYYIGRFIFKAIVHVLVASLNIIVFACRVLGFEAMNYIHLTSDNSIGEAVGGRGLITSS